MAVHHSLQLLCELVGDLYFTTGTSKSVKPDAI